MSATHPGRSARSTSRYMNKDHWGEIQRGHVYEAAMLYSPSDTSRPLKFFKPNESDNTKGSVVEEIGDFGPIEIDGELKAKEQYVVIGVKSRKVIVISNDKINQDPNWDYIMVVALFTVDQSFKQRADYQAMLNDDHPYFVYCPKKLINGKTIERYADISQLISVHKGVLIHKVEPLPPDRLELIEDLIIENMNLSE